MFCVSFRLPAKYAFSDWLFNTDEKSSLKNTTIPIKQQQTGENEDKKTKKKRQNFDKNFEKIYENKLQKIG